MRTATSSFVRLMVVIMGLTALGVKPAAAEEVQVEATYRDIEQTLGSVPGFFRQVPASAVVGAWTEMKEFQLNPKTQLTGKTKELIGLAVAAQIPCQYCIYFHTVAARTNGATDEEIKEAVAMSAVVRHWSTMLNGTQVNPDEFKRDTDSVMSHAAQKAKTASAAR